jgi:hypothetical protein
VPFTGELGPVERQALGENAQRSFVRDALGVSTARADALWCTAYSCGILRLVSKNSHPARAGFHEFSR